MADNENLINPAAYYNTFKVSLNKEQQRVL
jgi:hypothetical protein